MGNISLQWGRAWGGLNQVKTQKIQPIILEGQKQHLPTLGLLEVFLAVHKSEKKDKCNYL